MRIIDLTITYENGMTGQSKYHPVVEIKRLGKFEEIGRNTSSALLGTHIGTHMDAPYHFIENGNTIDNIDLNLCIGDVTIVDVRHRGVGDCLNVEDLKGYKLKSIVLLYFGWNKYLNTPQYNDRYPYITIEAANHMVDAGVKVIAMDIPSPDGKPKGDDQDFIVHRVLLKKEIIFVESLINTEAIDFKKEYTFVALPIKLYKTDAAPCRAILIEK